MKYNINDAFGSKIRAIVTLDGAPAREGVDYALFEGPFHKNGKWSYTEGGIAIKNGAFTILRRSTHSASDNTVRIVVCVDNKVACDYPMGRVSDMPEYPKFSGIYAELLKAAFESHLSLSNQNVVDRKRKEWYAVERFS